MYILKTIGVYEFRDFSGMLRRLLAELIGTFLLMAILLSGLHEVKSAVSYALANGLLLSSIIAYIGHISGGHVNPAVTVGMLVCNYIRLLPAMCYIIVQIIGALLGQLVAKLITDRHRHMVEKDSKKSSDPQSEFGLEVLETFLLVSVAVSVSDHRRQARGVGSAALAIGLSVAASLSAVTDYRSSLNPAASLATSVSLNSFANHWVCWVGPLLGGLLAGLVYKYVISYSRPSSIQVAFSPPSNSPH